ncbi:hypothetical protein L195_g025715, partial [Trifolium pratense]
RLLNNFVGFGPMRIDRMAIMALSLLFVHIGIWGCGYVIRECLFTTSSFTIFIPELVLAKFTNS